MRFSNYLRVGGTRLFRLHRLHSHFLSEPLNSNSGGSRYEHAALTSQSGATRYDFIYVSRKVGLARVAISDGIANFVLGRGQHHTRLHRRTRDFRGELTLSDLSRYPFMRDPIPNEDPRQA